MPHSSHCFAFMFRLLRAWLVRLFVVPALGVCLHAQTYTWRTAEIGGGGFVTGVVFHPTEPGLVYARTDVGGAYRLDTVTNRWIPLNDDIGGLNNEFQHLGVLSIGVDPSDANRLYIATGQYGGVETWKLPSRIYRSTNRGATWIGYTTPGFKMAGNGEGRGTGERFAVNPTNGATILLGTSDQGVWRSTDYGVTWAKTSFTPTSTNFLLYAPAVAPGPGPARRVYAAANTLTGQSFWFSDDNGTTWSEVANHPGKTVGHEMMPLQGSFDAAGVFYSTWGDATGPANYATDYGVWKMSADGSTWTAILPPTGQGFFAGISADPRVAGHVVVSTLQRWWPGDEVYRSTDGGVTWTAALRTGTRSVGNSPWSSSAGPHWMTDIDIDPFNSNRAIFNTGFGLFQTTTLASSGTARIWTFFNDGLEESVPLGLHSPTAGPPLVSVIGDYTGFRHDNLNRSPRRGMLNPGSGSTSYISGADLAPSKMIRQNSGSTLYSQDAGASWASFPTSPAPTINGQYRVILSADGQRLLWTPPNSPAYVSANNGATWTISSSSQSLTNTNGTATVSVLAGAAGVPDVTNGTGGSARFNSPSAIALDSFGVSYVADTANHTIRKIAAGGAVTTFAGGAGVSGSTNATGTAARFSSPSGIAVDASGNVYVADTANHTIRKITSAGVVTTLAGGVGVPGSTDATGTAARFNAPSGLAVDSSNNVFVCDTANHTIRKITSAGVVTTVAGSPGLSGVTNANGTSARFNSPQGITLDLAGNLYVADSGNNAIRKIASNGDVTTFAGLPGTSGTTDATGTAARFNTPKGITLDSAGVIHVADTGNHVIRKITSAGVVTTVAGLAGTSGTANGAGTTARFNAPAGIITSPDGINVYVADTANHTIRRNTIYNTLVPLVDRVDPLRFYLWDNTAKRLLTSTDGGVTFSTIATGVNSAFALFRTVPGNNGHIWARAGSSGLYRSTNFGATFTKLSAVAEVYQFDFGAAKPGNTHPAVFIWGKIGTTVGFFRSDDIGVTWTRINDNLRNFGYINDLAGDARTYGRVYLGTSGRGVVVGELVPAVAPAALPSSVIYGDALASGWTNVSPTGATLGSTTTVRRGTASIAITSGTGRGVSFSTAARTTTGFTAISFWVHGGTVAPPPLQIGASRGGINLEAYPITVPATIGWQRIVVSLADLGLDRIDDLTGLRIESMTVGGVTPGAFALDDITLVGDVDYPLLNTAVTISFGSLTASYNGTPRPVATSTTPVGRTVNVTYNGSSTVPTAAGTYSVVATLDDPFANSTASATYTITSAAASITLGNLIASADGTAKSPTYITSPAGLAATLTYNGSSTAPSLAGNYTVVATINDTTYQGSTTATFVIRQPALSPTGLTGWASNIAGKVSVNGATPSSPLLNPNDTTDSFTTNSLQSSFSPITLVNVGDKITLTGGLQLTLAGVAAQGNWFRFGLFDNRGQAPEVITGWLGLTAMTMAAPISVFERVGTTGYFSSGTGAVARTADASPAPVGGTSPSGTPPLTFKVEITRTADGIVSSYLVQRTDTTPATTVLSYNYTDTTPNNNGTVSAANTQNNTPSGYIPTYNTAGFAFARNYISTTGAQAQFSDIRIAFTPADTLLGQFITFPALADRALSNTPVSLAASASSGLPVTYSVVSGPATVSGSTLTLTGVGTVTVRASQAGNASYSAAPNVDQGFTVTRGTAAVTLGSLSATYDGSAKPATATTSPAGLSVALTYNGSATAPSAAGTYTVVATVNDTNYQGTASGPLVIAPASQSITFGTLPSRTFGDAPFSVSATASSGLPVEFSIVSGPALVSGNTITLTGAGTVVVRAAQPGDTNRQPAPVVDQSFTVAKAAATVALSGLSTRFDGQPKPVTVTTTPAALAVNITYNGSASAPSAIGTYPVVATVSDADYAGSASGTLVIDRRAFIEPVTGWLSSAATLITGADTSSPLLNANNSTGATGASVTFFAPITPRILSNVGDSLRISGNVTVNSPGGANNISLWFRYGLFDNPNAPGSKTVNNWLGYTAMAQAAAANSLYERIGGTTAGDFASSIYGTTGRTPDASPAYVGASSPAGVLSLRAEQTITRTSTGVTVVSRLATPGVGGASDVVYLSSTYTDTTPNNNGVGNGTIQTTATTPVYSPLYNAVGFVLSGGYINSTNNSSVHFADVESTFVPGTDASTQSITFSALPDRVYGDAPVTLAATASSGLPVSFSVVSGPAILNGSTLTLTGVGPVTVRASQVGNIAFLPARPVDRTFTVTKATASVVLTDLITTYDGTPQSVTVTTTPPGLNYEITYDDQAVTPTAIGTYAVSVVLVDPLYDGVANDTLVIQAIPQTITFAPLQDRTFGEAPFDLFATSSSGQPVSFSVLDGSASIVGTTLTINGAGPVTVRATQDGGSNYAAAAPVDQSFTVTKASASVILGNLSATYDGTPKSVSVSTTPVNLPVILTYSGSASAPSAAGSYAVSAVVNDANYQGSASGTLNIIASLVTPNPGISLTGGNISVTVSSQVGYSYQLQISTTLATGSWTNLGTAISGTGGALVFTDPTPMGATSRFYRIMITPLAP